MRFICVGEANCFCPPFRPIDGTDEQLPPETVAALAANVQTLGYVFSPTLLEACRALPLASLTAWYTETVETLRKMRGAHQEFKPFYPNFPAQVMEASQVELFFNAIVHYWTDGQWRPDTPKQARPELDEGVVLQNVSLGSRDEFDGLFTLVAASNTSLSQTDKDDMRWFVRTRKDAIAPLLPPAVPQKENAAYLSALFIEYAKDDSWATNTAGGYVQTATDILRLAVALSGGDVSLADSTKFVTLSRRERRFLLDLLNRLKNPVEDMLRWKNRWIRLGEKLHPGEFKAKYGAAYEAFQILRNDVPVQTFNGSVEAALKNNEAQTAAKLLATRPGDLARRLDHLLRIDAAGRDAVLHSFADVAGRVSTPVLLQVRQHFAGRSDAQPLRVFFPKGSLAKAHGEPNNLPVLPQSVCNQVVFACEAALVKRFAELPPLGKSYLDPTLRSLIESQILVSELAPPITGREPLTAIVDLLRRTDHGAHAADILDDAGRALRALDDAGIPNSPARYREVAASLRALPAEPETARLFQVDLYKPARHARLGREVVREIERATALLARIAPHAENEPLKRFREAFAERYGERIEGPLRERRMVPLALALDEEGGIGFGESADPSPLLDGLELPPDASTREVSFGPREEALLRGLGETLRSGRGEWALDERDLLAMETKNAPPLPDAFAVMTSIAAQSPRSAIARRISGHRPNGEWTVRRGAPRALLPRRSCASAHCRRAPAGGGGAPSGRHLRGDRAPAGGTPWQHSLPAGAAPIRDCISGTGRSARRPPASTRGSRRYALGWARRPLVSAARSGSRAAPHVRAQTSRTRRSASTGFSARCRASADAAGSPGAGARSRARRSCRASRMAAWCSRSRDGT